jgi:glutamate-1-semialdehyde 2,1-aminomutase
MQRGLEQMLATLDLLAVVARQGSAFCVYFMDHCPRDWHDLAEHHDFALDVRMRKSLVARGIYFFPMATKQCSISAAHTEKGVVLTLEQIQQALVQVMNEA